MLYDGFLHLPNILSEVVETGVEGVGKSLVRPTADIPPPPPRWCRCFLYHGLTEASHLIELGGNHCERLHTTLEGQLCSPSIEKQIIDFFFFWNWPSNSILVFNNVNCIIEWNLPEWDERVVFLCARSHCPQKYQTQSFSRLPAVPWGDNKCPFLSIFNPLILLYWP